MKNSKGMRVGTFKSVTRALKTNSIFTLLSFGGINRHRSIRL